MTAPQTVAETDLIQLRNKLLAGQAMVDAQLDMEADAGRFVPAGDHWPDEPYVRHVRDGGA